MHRRADDVEHGPRVVADALVAVPGVAVGDPQAERRAGRRGRRRCRGSAATSRAVVPSAVPVPTTPGPMPTTTTSAPSTWRASVRADGHVDRLEVAAEGVAGGDGAVEQARLAHASATRSREASGQGGAVGHHVDEPGLGAGRPWAAATTRAPGCAGVQTTTGMPSSAAGRSAWCSSAAPGVDLQARVAQLHDVAGPGLAPRVAGEVPVHDVPAAGAEAELDRGGVARPPRSPTATGPVSWVST